MDFSVIHDCKLVETRQQKVYKNKEVVGEKTQIKLATWGEKVWLDVDSGYSKELKLNVVGKATILSTLVSRNRVVKFADNDPYAKNEVVMEFDKLGGFEPAPK